MSEATPHASQNPAPQIHDPYEDFELPIAGFEGTPEEIERQWYEKVYLGRGDTLPQLTVRAVVVGSILGGILSLTNLYIGLKSGWGFGVSITASILSYAIWTSMHKMRIVGSQMGILETNCMKATSSSAGYSTGGTLISAYAAYILLNNTTLSIGLLMAWVFFIAILGLTMAIPMKRQMINIEQLRFPSGIACAETLKVLYSHGSKGMRSALALTYSGIAAGLLKFWEEGFELLRFGKVEMNDFSLATFQKSFNLWLVGEQWMKRTVSFGIDPLFIPAGALTGLRVTTSMLVGGTLCWCVFVPILQAKGIIDLPPEKEQFKYLVLWPLWGGVSCMVSSGLLSVGLKWRSVIRAFSSIGRIFSTKKNQSINVMEKVEAPVSWFFAGQIVSLIALAWLSFYSFGMPLWQSTLAVLLTFFLALVASRVTGETDNTPIGAMGKVMQLIFGALNPGNMNVNLMAANVTAGAASSSADLLTDLKTGYLLGANPRKQFLAQLAGVFTGTVVTVLCFRILVPTAEVIGGSQFPAPAAIIWKEVAVAMSKGIGSLEPIKLWLIAIGGLVGIVLTLLQTFFPKHGKWLPSAAGLGLSWTFQWQLSFSMFLGAVLGYLFEKVSPKKSEAYTFPIASGLIAGASLMGVLIIFIQNGPDAYHQFANSVREYFGK
jgi:OPT family oligopeptide transporter